jgi:hypothetical protein
MALLNHVEIEARSLRLRMVAFAPIVCQLPAIGVA